MSRYRWIRATTVALLLSALLAACGGAPQGAAPPAEPTTGGAPATEPTAAPAATEPTAAPAATEPAAAPATDSPAASGGTVRVGRTAAPDSLNPGAAYLSEAVDVFGLVYETLIGIDLQNKAIPQLAKEWSVGEDQRTWTFKLHEGAKWHDGEPVTSEDVAFTWQMIQGFDDFALIKGYTDGVEKIETPDPATVKITFTDPVADTDERFSGVWILPKHIWEQFKDNKSATEFENLEMIGSGPFKMAEYKQGEFTRLTAVKDHYLSPPKVDEVIFRVFTNNDAMVQAFRTGEVDVIDPLSTVIRVLQGDSNVKVLIGNNGFSLTHLIFNVAEKANCPPDDGKCTGHPALRDVKVRQALTHAIDKQQMIDVIELGLALPGVSLVMPGHGEAFRADLQPYAYDVAKAGQMLDEAGYKDTDGDGVREMPGDPATPLEFRFSYPSDQYASTGPRFTELLTSMWQQIGVKLKVQALEADAVTSICCPAFDFDVLLWGWGAGPDPASLLYILTTDEIPTGISETGYSNPEYDELFKEQRRTVDQAKRKELLSQLQEIAVRDQPYITLFYAQPVSAYRVDRFQGFPVDDKGNFSTSSRLALTAISPVQ